MKAQELVDKLMEAEGDPLASFGRTAPDSKASLLTVQMTVWHALGALKDEITYASSPTSRQNLEYIRDELEMANAQLKALSTPSP